ncbi:MAG: hypothetical protein H0U73_06115 [Tatlockia sp.]|nr:hypothetical protein [Tatlockia sp.]
MGLRREYEQDEEYNSSEHLPEEEDETERLSHKRHVRKIIEDRLERKRLKEDLDELDGEFDWEEYDRL